MAKKSCKKGYYYCYTSKKCKRIPMGYYVGGGGWLRKEEEKDESEGKKKNGNGNGSNGDGNGNGGSNGGSNGGGVSEAWSAKYKKSIDCDNPKGFSQKAHCRGRKMNEGTLHKWFSGSKSKDGKGGWVNVTTGGTCASDEPGEGVPKCVSRSKYESMTPAERKSASRRKKSKDRGQQSKRNAAKPTYVATDKPKRKTMKASFSNWRADLEYLDEGRYSGGGGLKGTDNIRYGAPKGSPPGTKGPLKNLNDIDRKLASDTKGLQANSYEPQGELVDEGKDRKGKGSGTKDACYHKVKSRYSVWPSAYASGALVKCRKVGAKNWGNKTKKEGYEFSNWRDDFQATEYESVDIIKAEPLKPTDGIGSRMLGEAKKCWKGYKKVGTQKLFGKTYNRCEKIKKEEVELQEAIPGYKKYDDEMKRIRREGLTGPDLVKALRAAAALRPKTEKEVSQKLGEDWQKSNRNDGVDGMSQKSVDAYKRENPGSKLQTAVTGKVKKGSKDSKRRKSFCARSDGQRKMHNIDCKKTPDKKICKARRRWKC